MYYWWFLTFAAVVVGSFFYDRNSLTSVFGHDSFIFNNLNAHTLLALVSHRYERGKKTTKTRQWNDSWLNRNVWWFCSFWWLVCRALDGHSSALCRCLNFNRSIFTRLTHHAHTVRATHKKKREKHTTENTTARIILLIHNNRKRRCGSNFYREKQKISHPFSVFPYSKCHIATLCPFPAPMPVRLFIVVSVFVSPWVSQYECAYARVCVRVYVCALSNILAFDCRGWWKAPSLHVCVSGKHIHGPLCMGIYVSLFQ